MEEIIKTILAAGGGVGSALLVYYVWKIEPRLRSIEITVLQGQQIDLLKLVRDVSRIPEIHERAKELLTAVEVKLKE